MIFLGPWGLISGLLAAVISLILVIVLSTKASSFLTWRPRNLGGLVTGMFFTAIAIIVASIVVLYLIAEYFGLGLTLLHYSVFIGFIMLIQWLVSPYLIEIFYGVRDADPYREGWLIHTVERLATRAGMEPPRVKVAEIDIPNAFAYGSPLSGPRVAVTRGLLETMSEEEIEAVLGHELGHLKHRDVQVLLLIAFLPTLIYYIGRILVEVGFWSGDRDREGGEGAIVLAGLVALVAGILFQFIVMHFNRLREYYADAHSALILGTGRPLQRALARLDLIYSKRPRFLRLLSRNRLAALLFIYAFADIFYDPVEAHIRRLMRKEVPAIVEIFSSHPPIPKRLRFLEDLEHNLLRRY
ncbi:MAG TPA: protease HtpX [Thermoprotei archaeon]|nr:MAG: protease HtpX [Thermoprotei archaeon]HDI75021.1 protease HtpX [Thermoprotei archaeon]